MRIRFFLMVFLLLLILPNLVLAVPIRHNLSNGLTLITSENHETPVVAFQVWVKAGSAYEIKGEYGISHFIEHMTFKGTSNYPAGQLARLVEAMGGEINAYTSFDHTTYYSTVPSRYGLQTLAILIDAIANAIFDNQDIQQEKEIVVEEIRMNADNQIRRMQEELQAFSYGQDYPYGRAIIGTEESVRAIVRQNILDYRAKWYRIPNMIVVAVGNFNTSDLLSLLEREKSFGKLDYRPAPIFCFPQVNLSSGPRLKVLREKSCQASLGIAWRVPGLPSEEIYSLDIAAIILGEGRAGRLLNQLKEKKGLLDSIESINFSPQGQGLFKVDAQLAPEKIAQAWPALITEIFSLISRPPSTMELRRAQLAINAEFMHNHETIAGQARLLGHFELLHGGFEKIADYLERYLQVDSRQVAKVAYRYFKPENLSMVLQIPDKIDGPDLSSLNFFVHKVFEDIIPPFYNPAELIAVKTNFNNGMTLIVKECKIAPLVSLVLAVPGGQAAEQPSQGGLGQLWSRLITRGTKHHNFDQLSQEIESIGAKVTGFSTRNAAGLIASFFTQNWQYGLKLVAEIWREPIFSIEQISRAKAEQQALLRAQEDSSMIKAFKLFRSLVYIDHPYGQDPLGTLESLEVLTRDDLLSVHANIQGSKGLVLSIVGAVDPEEVRIEVEQVFAGLKGKNFFSNHYPPPSLIAKPRLERINDPKAKQAQIVLGYQALSAVDPERHLLELMEALLGGQGGRLFQVLRDQYAFAYTIQPFYNAFWNTGLFGIYMAVGPGKENDAIRCLSEQIQLLRDSPPSNLELARAKNYLLGRTAISLQNYATQAMVMAIAEVLGLGFDDYQHMPERIQAVRACDLQTIARRLLLSTSEVQLILGP